ncbi:hypothetical protein Micbo1qcDRAFT_213883 [Microdochium bolleyi]|uniref:2EXR domain-containing protein n=1 Tax=Microdochium bolleyi TaxID=196109 RepID=A0A136IUU8_9PEZI|nr:hypothetical protein Micbo1qcDRAFT_213883 [Microdochium bolleyi]
MASLGATGSSTVTDNDAPAPADSESGFTPFPRLPPELQLLVWKQSVEEPRYYIKCHSHATCAAIIRDIVPTALADRACVSCRHESFHPALLLVCRESRDVVRARFPERLATVPAERHGQEETKPFEYGHLMFNSAIDFTLLSYREVKTLAGAVQFDTTRNVSFHVGADDVELPIAPPGCGALGLHVLRLGRMVLCYLEMIARLALWQAVEVGPPPCTFFLPDGLQTRNVGFYVVDEFVMCLASVEQTGDAVDDQDPGSEEDDDEEEEEVEQGDDSADEDGSGEDVDTDGQVFPWFRQYDRSTGNAAPALASHSSFTHHHQYQLRPSVQRPERDGNGRRTHAG